MIYLRHDVRHDGHLPRDGCLCSLARGGRFASSDSDEPTDFVAVAFPRTFIAIGILGCIPVDTGRLVAWAFPQAGPPTPDGRFPEPKVVEAEFAEPIEICGIIGVSEAIAGACEV